MCVRDTTTVNSSSQKKHSRNTIENVVWVPPNIEVIKMIRITLVTFWVYATNWIGYDILEL